MATKKPTRKATTRNKVKRTSSAGKKRTPSSKNAPVKLIQKLDDRRKKFLARRPHRSFRLTRRRDYTRSLRLPGYFSFTAHVTKILVSNKSSMLKITILYTALTFIFLGITSQQTYTTLSDTLQQTSGNLLDGTIGKVKGAGILLLTGVTGNFTAAPSPEQAQLQRVYAVLIGLLIWLTTVWSLRAFMAGQRLSFRDAVYNSGSPIVATFLVLFVASVQLVPAALGVLILSAGASSGIIDHGVEAMAILLSAVLLIVLSLYWITSTLLALVIVTLPGKYPMVAIHTAGDLVVGRRVRILLRLLWLAVCVAVIWIAVMIPIILIDAWLKNLIPAILWLPIVPIAFLLMAAFTVVFASTYVYLLYRKIVDDDAKPA